MADVARLAICSCGPPNRASFPKKKIFEDAITLSFMQEEKWKYSRRFSRGTTHEFGRAYAAFTNLNDAEFMQYRSPVGRGPSSNTCPKCASHSVQLLQLPWFILSTQAAEPQQALTPGGGG